MEYVEARDAQSMSGLRLALTKGVPGPWSEAAKNIFHIKGIAFTPVAQHGGQANPDLVGWTGHRNAPVAVYDDEPPCAAWADILMLAERLAPTPALLPEDPAQRVLVFGISHELAGEGGFGWSRRFKMLPPKSVSDEDAGEAWATMRKAYGSGAEDPDRASQRCADIVSYLASRLKAQAQAGSRYLVGEGLTAADVYWATFSQLYKTSPEEVNPMPDYLRSMYEAPDERIEAVFDPILLDHRDFIYQTHLIYPLDY